MPSGRRSTRATPIRSFTRTASAASSAARGVSSAVLHDLGVDTVLVVGTVTNVCCETTAREAAAYDFKTIMISDANAAPLREEDAWTYAVCLASYGDVMTADEALERLVPPAP